MAGYKINSKKLVVLAYTKDREAEREIRETSSFTIATNGINYLGITLTKEVRDLFERTLRHCRKKLKKAPENRRISNALGRVGLT